MKTITPHSYKAFTMVELIFVIVIIGVLATTALPKFRGLTSGAKISAEIATMSSVVTALEAINGEWSINEGTFKWGIGGNDSSLLNANGYPEDLNSSSSTFGRIIKDNSNEYTRQYKTATFSIYTGPASNPNDGVSSSDEKANKPDRNDFWIYGFNVPSNGCSISGKTIYPGDFILIDITGTGTTNYSSIACN